MKIYFAGPLFTSAERELIRARWPVVLLISPLEYR